MNRRTAIVGLAGAVGLAAGRGNAQQAPPAKPVPGAIALKLGQPIDIAAQSAPVKVGTENLHIVSIGRGTFQVDRESRLTAKLKAGVTQYARIDYWISAAVFDPKGRFLGAAVHKEEVQSIWVGRTLTVSREIAPDFGISKAFGQAAFVVVAVSERDVPKPG
jgi:hypothetical protein